MMRRTFLFILALCLALSQVVIRPPRASAHGGTPSDPTTEARYEQKLDAQLPLDAAFVDEAGQPVRLGQYLGRVPVVFLFAYYHCPMLCSLVLNDLAKNLTSLPLKPGDQFQIVTISIDPKETPQQAAEKKAQYLQEAGLPAGSAGWSFLTGAKAEIDRVAEAAGFHYVYDDETDEYAHPAGVLVLTPTGRISRYLTGLGYTATDLRLGLLEASQQKIASPVDQFFLLCYHYDPQLGRYSLTIENILRIAGSATVLLVAGMVLLLLRRERRGERYA